MLLPTVVLEMAAEDLGRAESFPELMELHNMYMRSFQRLILPQATLTDHETTPQVSSSPKLVSSVTRAWTLVAWLFDKDVSVPVPAYYFE